jgi:hypothetical protein
MLRTAIFVDAGYLFAQGSVLLAGEKQGREFMALDIPPLVDAFIGTMPCAWGARHQNKWRLPTSAT